MSVAIEYLAIRIPSTLKRQVEGEAARRDKSINTIVKEILDAHYYPDGNVPIIPAEPRARRRDAPG